MPGSLAGAMEPTGDQRAPGRASRTDPVRGRSLNPEIHDRTVVGLLAHDTGEVDPLGPAGGLQLRSILEAVDVADAEHRHRLDPVGEFEGAAHLVRFEDADPARAEPLAARHEHQVLHGGNGRVTGGLGPGAATEPVPSARSYRR